MKQPKVQLPIPPVAPPAAIIGPRYRYFSEPPAFVTVRAGDLSAVPADFRASTFEAGRLIELPSTEVLSGPVPKISLGRLAEIAPESFQAPFTSKTFISLPAAAVARAYKMIARQEMIEDVPRIEPLSAEVLAEEKFAPPIIADSPLLDTESFGRPPFEAVLPLPQASDESVEPAKLSEPSLADLPPPPPPLIKSETMAVEQPVAEAVDLAPMAELAAPFPPSESVLQAAAPEAPLPPPQAITTPPQPQNRRIFSMMPMFRRKIAAEAAPVPDSSAPMAPVPPPAAPSPIIAPPPVAENAGRRPRVELPPPKIHITPLSPISEAPLPPPPAPEIVAEPIPHPPVPPPPVAVFQTEPPLAEVPVETAPPASISEPPPAMLVETEHLPKLRTSDVQLANNDDLQALFLTEEMLSVDRVIELCGGLPGISSCVLSQASSVIASHNVPETIDLVSLSAHAVEMLRAMRASSAKMGVGAVPAVTIHSEKGPITFFNQEDICLLVLHKDRGFVPGVREKLQGVVSALAKSNLPRQLPSSSQSRILEG